jgi:signal transduction histidine kinase
MTSRRFPSSIRERILLPYLVLVVAMVALTGLASGSWAASRAREQVLERGRSIAETLRRSSFPLTEPVLRQLRGLGDAEFALLDDSGRVAASTIPGLAGPRADFPAHAELRFAGTWRHEGQLYRVGEVDRPEAGERARLLILLPESALAGAEWEARRAALVLSLVGAALAAALASWVSRTLSRPLTAILRAIRQVGQGDLAPADLPRGSEDEIGELAEGVAAMVERLRSLELEREQTERLRLIRQVSAGLAHELRNPLTAARMTIQIAIERGERAGADTLRRALGELDRMQRPLARFLQIARPEPPRFVQGELASVAIRAVEGLEALAEHRGVRISVECEPELPPVRLDPDQMGQVAANLILNAIEAAGPGGRVWVRAVRAGSDAEALEVEDDGPGVAEEDRLRLFQPFFTRKPEGVGLGLALCEALVREHVGSIEHRRVEDRTRFRVVLRADLHDEPGDGRVF